MSDQIQNSNFQQSINSVPPVEETTGNQNSIISESESKDKSTVRTIIIIIGILVLISICSFAARLVLAQYFLNRISEDTNEVKENMSKALEYERCYAACEGKCMNSDTGLLNFACVVECENDECGEYKTP
ncbi:MAG: hypothetical protein ABIE03_06375 [Patescibacteria group bacterium]|nr:hypothetical protein [Patescibacteria group bacterium]